jgi:hypothetical protein
MATGTAGGTGQEYHTNQVHYLSKAIVFGDDGSTLTLGKVPPYAAVIRGGVVVTTAFNAGSTNVLDIGTSDDTDGFATDLALGTVGVIVADEMATSNDSFATTERTIQCVVDLTGTAATTGAGYVWVEYIVHRA